MMRIWLTTFLVCGVLNASSITTPLLEVQESRATIVAENLREGMSGFIVRKFDATHSTIIANARVEQLNPTNGRAILRLSDYDGLRQNSLPTGNWAPAPSDTAVLAHDYERALLIAPNDDSYDTITKSIAGIEWIHPDNYATYLSYEGHPTPLVEDFRRYCTANSIGLLYIQSAQNLFTLDCKSFTLLQSTPSMSNAAKEQTPFFTRIPTIRAAWWGEGSSRLESYEPYYLEQIALNNSKNKELYELYKAKFSDKSALLRYFDLKE
ncbi:MAG TPA: hypothetical protein DDZ71_09680 [Sulfuricurvum sp.]|nr:hypothetical protein [Sulfuricurvum sp.]